MAKISEPKKNALEAVHAAHAEGYRAISAGTLGSLVKAGLLVQNGSGRYFVTDDGLNIIAPTE